MGRLPSSMPFPNFSVHSVVYLARCLYNPQQCHSGLWRGRDLDISTLWDAWVESSTHPFQVFSLCTSSSPHGSYKGFTTALYWVSWGPGPASSRHKAVSPVWPFDEASLSTLILPPCSRSGLIPKSQRLKCQLQWQRLTTKHFNIFSEDGNSRHPWTDLTPGLGTYWSPVINTSHLFKVNSPRLTALEKHWRQHLYRGSTGECESNIDRLCLDIC